ncbi:hypothetical protein ACA910_014568 [Epithemia clementina (nom. ined.)]
MVFSSPARAATSYDKADRIEQVLAAPEVNLWKLRELALSEGGLVNDALRRRAWPLLLGVVSVLETSHPPTSANDSTNEFCSVVATYPQQTEAKDRVSSQNIESGDAVITTEGRTEGDDVSVNSTAVLNNNVISGNEDSSEATQPLLQSSDNGSGLAAAARNNMRSRGPQLSVYFQSVMSSSQMLNLHRDDISISSSTTASVSNVGSVQGGGHRRHNLPVLATSLDARQIELDVQRCTWHLLTGDQRIQRLQMEHKRNRKVARLIRRKQRRLANLLNYTLVLSYPLTAPEKLRYYQGFHDVACIFMATLGGGTTQQGGNGTIPSEMHALAEAMGLDLPARVLVQVSQSHLRDFLKPDFKELQTAIELTVFPLIARLDRAVHDFLRESDMQPFFALSWVITWFSHEVRDTELVKRLFDVFLVSHPLMPIYLSVAMVLHPVNRRGVLNSEHDFGTVHQTLRDLPKNSSMTGWKYRPGDGYVSDDGEADDEDEDDSLEQAGIAGDFERIQSELVSKEKVDLNGTQSSVSTCVASLTESQARVPFQEIIDLALVFMRRVPPKKLLPLAVRYYGGPHVASLLAPSQNIRLFSSPAEFAVKSRTTADWVLQQRALNKQSTGEQDQPPKASGEENLKEVLSRMRDSPAVIALGFSEGEAKQRKRKRRRYMMMGALGVAVVAIAVCIAFKSYSSKEALKVDQGDADAARVLGGGGDSLSHADGGTDMPASQSPGVVEKVVSDYLGPSTHEPVRRAEPVEGRGTDFDGMKAPLPPGASPPPRSPAASIMPKSKADIAQMKKALVPTKSKENQLDASMEAPQPNQRANRLVIPLAKIMKSPIVYQRLLPRLGDEAAHLWSKVTSDFHLLEQAGREGKAVLVAMWLRMQVVSDQIIQRTLLAGKMLASAGRALYDKHGKMLASAGRDLYDNHEDKIKLFLRDSVAAIRQVSRTCSLHARKSLFHAREALDRPATRKVSSAVLMKMREALDHARELFENPPQPAEQSSFLSWLNKDVDVWTKEKSDT